MWITLKINVNEDLTRSGLFECFRFRYPQGKSKILYLGMESENLISWFFCHCLLLKAQHLCWCVSLFKNKIYLYALIVNCFSFTIRVKSSVFNEWSIQSGTDVVSIPSSVPLLLIQIHSTCIMQDCYCHSCCELSFLPPHLTCPHSCLPASH